MSEEMADKKSLVPHIIAVVLIVLVIIAGFFWLQESSQPEPVNVPVAQSPEPAPEPTLAEPEPIETEPQPTFEEPVTQPDPQPIEEPLEPEPLDTSDGTLKTLVLEMTDYETAAALLVNDDLLRRFVVQTTNMANGTLAPRFRLMNPPEHSFRVYQQADKEWIDAASYKRYTPYVDVLEGLDNEKLIDLYRTYKPAIREVYAEIGDPDDNFDYVLVDAINHLLDTPEVPVPVEVYTDSVMYKYRNERLENLSAVQKQLLRTGPENMRRIKAKLRELKAIIQQ
ncbi:DUF3014 domain-containing protein [Aestuariibacter halophilus]|uniref:DUF3014 domain-containing protein n=1 Tax=Fluctibacter halophilus TaxID=226011 RepID=A0ABS8GCP2_9ALTE|nr:DUF3014 domain-containing protein [Aestuariibacter halophilus]MCC2616966.1 DUF3014 domain-containing protein [Aestuariibacter halophilus]